MMILISPATAAASTALFIRTGLPVHPGLARGFGNWLEHRDTEAFKALDAIWQNNSEEFFEKYDKLYAELKFNAYRGQVFRIGPGQENKY